MASQYFDGETDNVEIIDLTNETTRQNTTITIEDSFAIEIVSSEADTEDNYIDYPPELSPLSILDRDDDSSNASSLLPSRLPSSLSTLSSPMPSPLSTPSPKVTRKTSKLSPNMTKSNAQKLNKKSREEAKKLKLKQKEEDKLQKQANRANAANKALDNCTANIDRNILKIINDHEEISFRTLFDESMVKYQLTDYPNVENSISWTYKRAEVIDGSCVSKFKSSTWMIVTMQGSEYLRRLLIYKADPSDPQSIKNYLSDIRRRSQLDVILFVYNLASYLKSERMKDAKNYRKTFKDRFESTRSEHGEIQDDMQILKTIGSTDLQDLRLMLEIEYKQQHTDWKLHIEFYEKTSEIVQAIVRYTLSIARLEVKQKVRTSTGLDWAINMDKERAVDPTKSSEDLTKLWITQLQQFPQITLPIAKAIAAEYPSPCALLDQYKTLTTSEAEDLLAGLYVQRNLKRQIGSNISKRIHRFMTCQDPNFHIGLS